MDKKTRALEEETSQTEWNKCVMSKEMRCKFCQHLYKTQDGYPSIFIDDQKGADHLKRLVMSHMEWVHPKVKVGYNRRRYSDR